MAQRVLCKWQRCCRQHFLIRFCWSCGFFRKIVPRIKNVVVSRHLSDYRKTILGNLDSSLPDPAEQASGIFVDELNHLFRFSIKA
jgi:hypothetical protein